MLREYIALNESVFKAPQNRFPKETPPKIAMPVLKALIAASKAYAKEFGIKPHVAYNRVLFPIAWCESTFNPNAHNGSFHGLYQFNRDSWKTTDQSREAKTDPFASAMAFVSYSKLQLRLLRSYSDSLPVKSDADFALAGGKEKFESAFEELKPELDGFHLKPYFMYLMHQQGAWGFSQIYVLGKQKDSIQVQKLDSGSERSILKNVGSDWKQLDFTGKPVPASIENITINDFIYYWKYKMAARVASGTPYEYHAALKSIEEAKRKSRPKN
jgi:hypothetical protein